MTFADQEESLQEGRPVELYEFTVGNETFRYTNSERSENFGGFDWQPVALTRDQVALSPDEPGSSVQVMMANEDPNSVIFTQAWVAQAPNTGDTRVRIYRHHQDDVDEQFQLFWIGYLVSPSYEEDGSVFAINCKSLDNLFTMQGPRKNWGTLCNHQLYGSECTLSIIPFTYAGVITAIASDGVTITVSGIPAATVTFVGGELIKPGTLAAGLIVQVSGNDFTVQYPIPNLEVGDSVQIIEGCNHTLTQCALFPNASEASGTNVENFGASPYTPPVNIFTKGGDAL